jgi:hypothetical protein
MDTWNQERRDVKMLRDYMNDLIRHQAWRYLPDPKKPVNNPGKFLKDLIGLDAGIVVKIVAAGDATIENELKVFLLTETAGLVKPGRPKKATEPEIVANGDNNDKRRVAPGSNNADELLKRVARLAKGQPLRKLDHQTNKLMKITSPELQARAQEALEAYRTGNASAREAAIMAGIITSPDPLNQLRRWWRAATPDQRAAFKREMDEVG